MSLVHKAFKTNQENTLKTKYLKEKQNLEDAPNRFNDAEKNYYTFEYGKNWYNDFKENQTEKTVSKTTLSLELVSNSYKLYNSMRSINF